MQRSRAAILASLAALAASCSSTPERAPVERLPFHVSVLPIEIRNSGATDGGVPLELDRELLRRVLADELSGDCFVRVSTPNLPTRSGSGRAPEGLEGDPASWSGAERELFWLHDAGARRVDLLAQVSLELDPTLRSSTNGRFWMELPLFLLGGPFCYWVDDRTYEMDAVLRVRLFDAHMLGRDQAGLDSDEGLLAEVVAPYSGTSLNFLERVGGRGGDWALSLLCPSGLLAKDTPAARAAVADDLLGALALDFETALQAEREGLLMPGGVNFFIRPGDLTATRGPGGTIDVRGVVRFFPDARVESLKGFSLSAGDTSANYRFGDPRVEGGGDGARTFLYEVNAGVTPGTVGDSVQVQIFHGGGDDRSRTFTLALDGGSSADSAQ